MPAVLRDGQTDLPRLDPHHLREAIRESSREAVGVEVVSVPPIFNLGHLVHLVVPFLARTRCEAQTRVFPLRVHILTVLARRAFLEPIG